MLTHTVQVDRCYRDSQLPSVTFRLFMNLLVSLCACVMRVGTVCVIAISYALLVLHILTYPHNTSQASGSYADS